MNELFPALPANAITGPVIAIAVIGTFLVLGGIVANIGIVSWLVKTAPSIREMGDRIHRKPWHWRDVALITTVLGLLHLTLLVCLQLRTMFEEPSNGTLILSIAAQTAIFHGGGYILVADRLRRRRISWQEAFGVDFSRALHDLGKGLVFYLAAMPFVIGAAFCSRMFMFLFDYEIAPQQVIKMLLSSEQPLYLKVYLAFLAVAVAPFVEELLFRGVALPAFAKQVRLLPAIALVSLLFAAIHFSIPALLPLFVIATAFALAYLLSGSLLVPIVMHIAFNSVSLVMIALSSTIPTA